MKKPKKTAAKPPAGEKPSTPAKAPGKSLKAKPAAPAASSEPVEPSKKSPVKRPRKSTAKAPEATPPIEIKPAAETKPAAEAKVPAKPKRIAKTKATAKVQSPPEIKPAAVTAPTPEIKTVAKIPPAPEIVKPKPLAEAATPAPAPETKPKPQAKPKAKTKPPVAPPAPVVAPPPLVKPTPPISAPPAVESKPKMEKPVPPAPAPVMRAIRPARKTPSRIPPILLEGDRPAPATISGPGQRYALGPTPPIEKLPTEGELPESYGTKTLLLTARDPHWLYTHWDLSADQQRRYNAYSRDGHLVVRIYLEAARSKPVTEIHVHPESRHWFVHVDLANTRYVAELGYYSAAEKWAIVATSAATLTPPDAVSADTSAQFGVIPIEVPMQKLLSLVKEAVHENAPLAQALQELRADGHAELPPMIAPHSNSSTAPHPRSANGKGSAPWKPTEWTPAQERALAEVISMDHVRRVWMGSLEITELIRRQLFQEAGPGGAPGLGAISSAAPMPPAETIIGISSPVRKAAGQKGFWFNVNAELIVYGATEPDATVSIGGRKIKLRPDGSFSYRFALPDGNYEMPAIAVSADQTDGRAADLKFSRHTEYRGDIGAHPQDPALRPMATENF